MAGAQVPGTSFSATVSDVTTRWRYIDARVSAGGFGYRFFFPDTEVCRAVIEAQGVRFVWLGMGQLQHADQSCPVVGILSLAAWRDRQPRRSREPVPRTQASYEVVYRDADMVLARGRFRIAGLVGWVGGEDTIGVIPDTGVCQDAIDSGVASSEFRPRGPDPIVLVSGDALCPMLGFAKPPDRIPELRDAE